MAQGVDPGVPALDIAVDAGGIQVGFRITAQHAQAPLRIERPIGTEHAAFGALFQTAVAMFAVELAVATDGLQPESALGIRVVEVARFGRHAGGREAWCVPLIKAYQQA